MPDTSQDPAPPQPMPPVTQPAKDTPTTQQGVLADMGVTPTQASNIPYLVTVAVMFFIGLASVVAIAYFRPATDILTIIAAVFAFLTPTTASVLAFQKAQETHLSVNSRLDGFIKNAQSAALAAGKEQGAQAANARTDALNNVVPAPDGQATITPIILPTVPPVKIDIIKNPNE